VDVSYGSPGGEIRTFLIADVRGYTHFTEEEGDEAAASLAASFAALARDVIAHRGGDVIELRGDEALAVFTSARQALRGAVELQRRSRADPGIPLGIGIGLDAGEALPVEGGYRGGALNLASRLCNLAEPGQVLMSETVARLARRVDGITLVKRRAVRLKGLDEAVRVVEAVPDPPLPPLPAPPVARQSFVQRHHWPLLASALLLVGVAVALSLLFQSGGEAAIPSTVLSVPSAFTGVVELDPHTDRVVQRIPIAGSFDVGSTAFAAHSLWIAGSTGITRVDLGTRKTTQIPVTGGANGLAASDDEGIWEANQDNPPFDLLQINPYRNTVKHRLRLRVRPTAGPYVGAGFVWLVVGSNTLYKIDPGNGKVVHRTPYLFPFVSTNNAAAAGEGAFWFADPEAPEPGKALRFGAVVRFDPRTDAVTTIPVPHVNGLVVGGGAVWTRSGPELGNPGTGKVTEINPDTNRVLQTIDLGRTDWIKAGNDAIWVQDGAHELTRLNPATGEPVSHLVLPRTAGDFGEGDGRLWVLVWPTG
jgi:class 3 adenylate cyclase/outer membrane protein assembly factor BamB